MATIARPLPTRVAVAARLSGRPRLWLAVVSSRLLVVLTSSAAALWISRVRGWEGFDPSRSTLSFGSVGNVLSASAMRWDALWYVDIARNGYRGATETVFFPLYPALIRALGTVTGSEVAAGMAISMAAFAVAIWLLHRLTELELGRQAADTTVLLLAFAPLSLFFTAVYTESLFLALTLGAVYAARRQRFGVAIACATAATLTRVPGILVLAPVAVMYVRGANHRRLTTVALITPLLALGGFCLYLRSLGYGLLAPVTNQEGAAHEHSMAGPLATVVDAFARGIAGFWQSLGQIKPVEVGVGGPFSVPFQNAIYLTVLAICALALVEAWRLLPKAYAIYATLVLICCVWSPVADMPLRSLDRYALVIFPLWMSAGAWVAKRRLTWQLTTISALLLSFYTVEFARWVFIA